MPTVRQAEMPTMDKYGKLLAEVARLHERHVASNPEPFNVFSVLRSESDEVNLHSRFLAALLDYRNAGEEERSNLGAFLKDVAKVDCFDQHGISVEREKHNIDILITNASRQAVVIENKIWAGDQPAQLQRYHSEILAREFPDEQIHLCYLTPFGHDPSEESVGELSRERIVNIAYNDPTFQDWLRSCQQRACNEPELRESVGQYLRIVQKLTGTDVNKAHLKELTNLCLEKDHLALVHDLTKAFDEAWIQVIHKLFGEIENELKAINDLPNKHDLYDVSEPKIRNLVTGSGNSWCGQYFRLTNHSQLGIELNTWRPAKFFFGVRCIRADDSLEHERIKKELSVSDHSTDHWPFLRFPNVKVNPSPRNPRREHLIFLVSDAKRQALAQSIAKEVATLWQKIKDAGLNRPPPA